MIFIFPMVTFAEKKIVIDPGHGGVFTGTCGYSGDETGFCEKDANLLISQKLKEVIEAFSEITVYMTRDEDVDFIDDPSIPVWHNDALFNDMENRMTIANEFVKGKNDTSIFISVHHNQDVTSQNTHGTETFYYDGINNFNQSFPPHPKQIKYYEDNKRLGEITHHNLLEMLGLRDRELRNNQSFFVLRHAQMPAILVEIAFLTNPEEEALIKSEDFQEKAAIALAKSVFTYFEADDALNALQKTLDSSIEDSIDLVWDDMLKYGKEELLNRQELELAPEKIKQFGFCMSIATKQFFGINNTKFLPFQLRNQHLPIFHGEVNGKWHPLCKKP